MYKRVFVLNILLSAITVLLGTMVEAVGADIKVTGKVIASSCTVNTVLAGGQEIDLGTLGRTRFQHANDAGDWKSFTLNLTDCPPGTTLIKATYTGTQDGVDATLFANTEPAITAAAHMAVQMAKDADRSAVLSSGSTMTANVDTLTGNATFKLAARMYTPSGRAYAGRVSSNVLVSFEYK